MSCGGCYVDLKKATVLVVAPVLCLIIGLATPALAQGRGGGGGGTHGGSGAGGAGGGGRGPGGPGGGGPGAGGPGHGGPGPGHGGTVYRSGGGYYGGYYRYPYYGYRYYGYPYGYGWYGSPYFYAGWGWPYAPYPYSYAYAYGGGYDPSASVRLDVTPKEAEVYIDGYLTGSVDDFDGSFQRLRVAPGAHELTLYRDGFKTVHQSLHLSSGSTFRVSYKMEPLAPGEVAEARPTPPPPPSDESEGAPVGPPEGRPVPHGPPRGRPPAPSAAGFGTLAIRVQPTDAIVLIDGERWQTSSAEGRLVVDVPQGPHRIEIRKEGFDTYSTEITTSQGDTVPINVSLRSR